MAALLVLGFALVHFAGRSERKVSQDEALVIARPRIDFTPTGHQIRYIRRGIPSHGFWVVSFYIEKTGGGYKRATVVLVNATTGKVAEVKRTA